MSAIIRLEDTKVANKVRAKMDISNRAKQFMPFAALRGLSEALAAKEHVVVPKPALSEDMTEQLDRKMHLLERGKIASVIYYHKEECIKITGIVARIDTTSRLLQIVNTKIPFDEILEIEPEP